MLVERVLVCLIVTLCALFCIAVCFRVFDSDGDGLLSRQELMRATRVLRTIETENADEGVVKGDPSGEGEEVIASDSQRDEAVQVETPEQTALSALKNFSNKHVSIMLVTVGGEISHEFCGKSLLRNF